MLYIRKYKIPALVEVFYRKSNFQDMKSTKSLNRD